MEMGVATADTTKDDLAIAFDFGKRAAALDRFIEENVTPAYQRLEAAGYDGAWLVGTAAGLTSDQIQLDDLEILRTSNGYPGAADWLFYRVENLEAFDERGRDWDDDEYRSKLNAFLAFDRLFGHRYANLYRMLVIAASRSTNYHEDREQVIEGKRYEDIKSEIFTAVGEITGAEPVA
jgi:hypothetical protein